MIFFKWMKNHIRQSLVSKKKTQIPSKIAGRKETIGDQYVPLSCFELIFSEGFFVDLQFLKLTSPLKINGWKMKTSPF